MTNPMIINFAPTGMIPTKQMTPHVPISINEIVEEVLMAAELGVSIAHLHARDEKSERPTADLTVWDQMLSSIRKYNSEIILCVSLSGRDFSDPEMRANPLNCIGNAKPDMGSLTTSSLNFPRSASINSPSTIRFLAERMVSKRVKPEIEIFDLGMCNAAKYLERKGLIGPRRYQNIILGNPYGAQATLSHFAALADELSGQGILSFGGIGKQQNIAISLAIASGHHVRVGLEDNIWMDNDRTQLATNRDLLEKTIKIGEMHERTLASPMVTRELLGLSAKKGVFGLGSEKEIANQ